MITHTLKPTYAGLLLPWNDIYYIIIDYSCYKVSRQMII